MTGNSALEIVDKAKTFQIAQVTCSLEIDGVNGEKLHGHGHDALFAC